MDIILRRKLQHMNHLNQKNEEVRKNEAVKYGSYERVLQRRRKQVFVKPIGDKKNGCLCPAV